MVQITGGLKINQSTNQSRLFDLIVGVFAFEFACVFSSALRCATDVMQASVVRPSVVCRPSVKLIFSEPVKQINAKFSGKVPFHHISRPFFFLFSKFRIFYFL